ncbi:GroES-like protein [Schizophyllum commune H4-8]|nr:GroES-like protein [Schizophyllum commune H4-8]KAI5895250.1 GroES-like protein [Schizophyllum commune H4-8]
MTTIHKDIPETQIAALLGPNERSLTTIPVGKPGPNEVLIENVAVAANPKDWKAAEMMYAPGEKFVEGNDVAGTIVAVGEGVSEYKYGAYQQYTVAPASTTFPIPNITPYEEAATLPLAVMTAAIAFFVRLGIPAPDTAAAATNLRKAVIIYGASTSVGAYAVQLAKKAGLFVVGIAGASKDYAKELGADVVVDYSEYQGEQLIDALVSAVADHPTPWALDAIQGDDSALILARALAKIRQSDDVPAHVATVFPVLPEAQRSLFPSNVTCAETYVGTAYGEDEQFAATFYRKISHWLSEGSFKCNRPKIMPGGLADVFKGIDLLKNGEVHGEKLVYRIADTPGIKA